MPDKYFRVHCEFVAHLPEPVAEFNIFKYGQEVFLKSSAFHKDISADNHCMCRYIIRRLSFCFRVVYEYGLECAEEIFVVRNNCIGSADDCIFTCKKGFIDRGKSIFLEKAVCINKKENLAAAVLCAYIPCL